MFSLPGIRKEWPMRSPYVLVLLALTWLTPSVRSAAASDALAAEALQAAGPERGLCLCLGDADGQLTLALAKSGRLQVLAMAAERDRAEALRRTLAASPLATSASAAWRRAAQLPVDDDLINLVVAANYVKAGADGVTLAEIVRVLHPGGTALVGSDAGSDAAALATEAGKIPLAKARVLPRKGAWIAISKEHNPAFGEWSEASGGPDQSMASDDTAVAPGKEIRWVNRPVWAEMRGSYNGEILAGGRAFHEELDLVRPGAGTWSLIARDAYNGVELWRESLGAAPGTTLCADDKRVFRREGGKLVARDVADGKVLRTYGPSGNEIHASSVGEWLLVGGEAIEKETGKSLWKRPAIGRAAAMRGVAYVPVKEGVEAVNIADGKTLWKASGVTGRVFCKGSVVYVVNIRDKKEQETKALDSANGQVLWTRTSPCTYTGVTVLPNTSTVLIGNAIYDARSGQKVADLPPEKYMSRCWGLRGTELYVLGEQRFYYDCKTGAVTEQNGVRSACGIGQLPAYGLVYNIPHLCFCRTSVRGFVATSGGSHIPKADTAPVLFKGASPTVAAASAGPEGADWPVYRGNGARGNSFAASLPAKLKKEWSIKLSSGPLAQATVAAGLVLVADVDAHRVVALDAATGKEKWSFAAEGRVPIAPTCHKGLCLFGDCAGWVYCLEAATGKLAWQFQAAPEQKYMAAFGQLESASPVNSGVLVAGDRAWFTAGRCGTMDSGLVTYALDPVSGQVLLEQKSTANTATDMLATDGTSLFSGSAMMNPTDGKWHPIPASKCKGVLRGGGSWQGTCPILDLLEVNRTVLHDHKDYLHDDRLGGEMLAFDKDRTVISKRYYKYWGMKDFIAADDATMYMECKGASQWVKRRMPQQFWGMVLAGERVYCAGRPVDPASKGEPELWVLASADGSELQKLPLEGTPSVDGLSAGAGRLFVATEDGRMICFGADGAAR
jgi:outer membrane protein assembly factor BamB